MARARCNRRMRSAMSGRPLQYWPRQRPFHHDRDVLMVRVMALWSSRVTRDSTVIYCKLARNVVTWMADDPVISFSFRTSLCLDPFLSHVITVQLGFDMDFVIGLSSWWTNHVSDLFAYCCAVQCCLSLPRRVAATAPMSVLLESWVISTLVQVVVFQWNNYSRQFTTLSVFWRSLFLIILSIITSYHHLILSSDICSYLEK